MSKRGENIYKRKDGRWEGRYCKCKDGKGRIRYGYVYGKTYKEAKYKLQQVKSNTMNEDKQNKFRVYCLQWLDLTSRKVKPSSYCKYRNVVNNHIIPLLGNYRINDINYTNVEKMKNELLLKELSPKSIQDIIAILKSIIRHCELSGIDISSTCISTPKVTAKPIRTLTPTEQKTLITALSNGMDEVKFGIMLCLLTGMRIGEICALTWGDISFENKTISVSKTMQRIQCSDTTSSNKTKIIIGTSKTDASTRLIPLTEPIIKMCSCFRIKDPDAYILTGTRAKYIEPRRLQFIFKKITDEYNLKDVHFHTLRHTFATSCVEAGFEIKALSEVLGHSNTKTTLDKYVHSSLDFKRANMQKLIMPML